MLRAGSVYAFVAASVLAAPAQAADKYRPPVAALEVSEQVPMPPGFGVQATDADGPVFVDANGMTLYTWQRSGARNGFAGEVQGKPVCDATKLTVNAGLMSPYPPGLLLPDADTRPSCIDVWPPAYAPEDAKETGKFTVVKRPDGRKQWAYDGYALYTSVLDKKPGQVNGASTLGRIGEPGALRKPASVPSLHPSAFVVTTVQTGRLLTTREGYSLYTWDGDGPNKSNCNAACLKDWTRVKAGANSVAQGEWGVIEPVPGQRQWTFRGKPLYTRVLDHQFRSLEGSDVPGWHNAYTQVNPALPKGFRVEDSRIGQVVADKNGKTVYMYNCIEDTTDQLSCNHPTTTQAYRLAVCGDGDAALCNKTWLYVEAPPDAKTDNLVWATAWIDPATGHFAAPNAAGALHVWTFRDRPIYTYAGDAEPGDSEGDGWGEVMGARNGFKAMWLRRDDFTTG